MIKYRLWFGLALLILITLLVILLGDEQLTPDLRKVLIGLVILCFSGFFFFTYRLLKTGQHKLFSLQRGDDLTTVAVQVRKNAAEQTATASGGLTGQQLDTAARAGFYKKKVLEMEYSSKILTEFVLSIRNNMNKYSLPLAEGMYLIKQKVNDFLKNLLEWREELTKETSDKNFNRIIGKYSSQNEEFKNIFDRVNDTYTYLENNFKGIETRCDAIYQNTNTIEDVSEKIRVLSINASIEAVRAGEYGKGFKIISAEIKKLANMTQSAIDNIEPLIKETRQSVNATIDNFMGYAHKITSSINQQKDEFGVFYDTLKNYYNDLNKVFTSATQMIDEINININNLTPVFFMTNMSQQGLDNIAKIIGDTITGHAEVRQEVLDTTTPEEQKEILAKVVAHIKNIITTEVEVEVLNNFRKGLNMEEIKLDKKGETDAELF